MNSLNFINFFLLGVLSSSPMILPAHHVVIENNQGETFILPVDPEDRFQDVIDSIQAFKACDLVDDQEEYQSFTLSIAAKNLSPLQLCKKVRPVARSFAAGISAQESADIVFILKTMANSSLPKIKSAESALKKAGERIDHIHPYFFLSCIFTNEELKVCIRNLQGRAWVWKEFLRGIVDSLEEEHARGNVLPFVHDFAARVKVDANVIIPILQAGRWERFVNTLIDIVPREGGADRYNM